MFRIQSEQSLLNWPMSHAQPQALPEPQGGLVTEGLIRDLLGVTLRQSREFYQDYVQFENMINQPGRNQDAPGK